jgi:hypothetical protein
MLNSITFRKSVYIKYTSKTSQNLRVDFDVGNSIPGENKILITFQAAAKNKSFNKLKCHFTTN